MRSVRLDEDARIMEGSLMDKYADQVVDFLSVSGKCFLNERITLRRISGTNNVELSSCGPGNEGNDVVLLLSGDIRDLYEFFHAWLLAHKEVAKKKVERVNEEELESKMLESNEEVKEDEKEEGTGSGVKGGRRKAS